MSESTHTLPEEESQMPLIHVYVSQGTFSSDDKDQLAEELTTTLLEAEELPLEPFQKSTAWIYFHELPERVIYHGGKSQGTRIVALEISVFRGGLDDAKKRALYKRMTEIVGRYLGIEANARVPLFIVVRDVDPIDWGAFGGTTDISELRRPDIGLDPI